MINRLQLYEQLGITPGPEDKTKLTQSQIIDELDKLTNVENKTGFLYFLLEYVKVRHPSEGVVILKDRLYKWQAKAAQEFINTRYIISKKTRQVAFSTTTGAYALWRALFFEGQSIAIISLAQRESTVFLRDRIKFVYDKLPIWMQSQTSEFAKTSVSFINTKSTITSLPNNEDPARGESLSLLIVDEFAAMTKQQDLLAAGVPALSAGAQTPFTNHSLPSQLFIISTLPRKRIINNEYLRILHEAQDHPDKTRYKIIDVDVADIPQYQSDEWHREQRETLGDRIYKIEILGEEVYEVEDSLIPPHVLAEQKEIPPIRVDFLYPEDVDEEGYGTMDALHLRDGFDPNFNYIPGLWIWENPDPNSSYVVIADIATGRSDDFSSIIVMNPIDNVQVAEYKGRIDTEKFKDILLLIAEYYNHAKLSVENTGLGGPVAEYFGTRVNYDRFYWHKKSKMNYIPGFPMNTANRANSLAILQTVVVRGEIEIRSVRLINELRTFGYNTNGKIEAIGGHDDIVMALAQYCYLQNAGWAVSDSVAEDSTAFGALLKEDRDKEKEKSSIAKYWENQFDVILSPEEEELINLLKVNGAGLPVHLIEKIIEDHEKANNSF